MDRQLKLILALLLAFLLPIAQITAPTQTGVVLAAQRDREGHANGVTGLVFSPDGATLASVGRDSVIRISDVATAQQLRVLQGHEQPIHALAFSPDGKTLVSVGEDTKVFVWELATGKLVQILSGHVGFIDSVAFSKDGKTIITGSEDARIILWDTATGQLRQTLRGHADAVTSIAVSPDGKTIASSSKDKTIKLWNATTGLEQRALKGHTDAVTSIAFNPTGSTLISASADKTVKIWNTANGVLNQSLRGPTKAVNSVAFSPDGKSIASGSEDRTIDLWDAGSGAKLKQFKRQLKGITSVAFSPDSKTLASGSGDGTIILWDTATGVPRTIAVPPAALSTATNSSLLTTTDLQQNKVAAISDSLAVAQQDSSALLSGLMTALTDGPGGPILVITSTANKFSTYYTEILRNEGLNAFATADISTVSAATLAAYDVAILGEVPLTAGQVTMLSDWVNTGGNLIAMRPDKQLATLLGLADANATLANAYLLVDTTQAPGSGIVNQTMQFHGIADRYTLSGATSVATLYSGASTSTPNPAVSLRSVGVNGGYAAAFTFDLARSIVYTRQGNPAWAAQERDGFTPIRSDDLYYGASATDPQSDWVDLNKVAIPQADEQQRLLANLILKINLNKKPLPRFWYLPFGKKAAILMTGDDHGNGGTAGRFDTYIAASTPGCNVANWECIRGTSYVYPGTPLTDTQAASYTAQGFEVGLHINTGCADFTPTSLESFYTQQLGAWANQFPNQAAPTTQRHHCIVWSDWLTAAKTMLTHGMRLDTSYYYWPPNWAQDRPGLFSGTAMPMRLVDSDGTMVDVYEAVTQMTDESGQSYPFTVNTLLDRAIGPEAYYGVYTVNAHTDSGYSSVSESVLASVQSRGVPIVTAKQMLTWLDARNSSAFSALSWNTNVLNFTVTPGSNANGLQAMVPTHTSNATLTSLTRGGNVVTYALQTIKGVEYAFFDAATGTYTATYAPDSTPPTVINQLPANGATGVSPATQVNVTFSEAVDPATVNTNTIELRDASSVLVPAAILYNTANNTAILQPNNTLAANNLYTVLIKSGTNGIKDLAGNALATDLTWSFTTLTGPSCPCSIWASSATPTTTSANDPNAIELGVKFRTDVDGFITGIRFYKGTGNTGTHIGHLWTASGQLLATATFANETASGWQEVTFSSAVAVTANTTYIASYHTDAGNYAFDSQFFGNAGIDNAPLHALQNGIDGPNGVYKYGASAFPTDTYQSSNYWVDVVFTTNGGLDTAPPTITTTTPASGATGVSPTSNVTATFNEAIDPATVSGSTFELRNPSNALITAVVTYDAPNKTAILTPSAALVEGTVYTARVKGGASGVKDLAGNALTADVTWSFTTTTVANCASTPCSIWSTSTTPANPAISDPNPYELGVKFRSDSAGYISGIRFYKGTGNTGTHIGNLWSSSGQQLATATFVNETATGWQTVTFSAPVPISANTTYIASYHTAAGVFAEDASYFAASGVVNPPLRALQNGIDGPNGVYKSGASGFPNQTYQSSNYWVDVLFTTSVPADTTAPTVVSTTPTNGTTSVNLSTSVTALFSESIDPATMSASTFELRDPGNTLVPAAVTYDLVNKTATLTPNAALAVSTTYTAQVKGGASGVKDPAGNALATNVTWSFTTAAAGPCVNPANAIVAENCLTGNPSSEWDISGVGDASIQGYATDISVNRGSTISFKVKTDASNYRLDIYRLGYYGGNGARKIATVQPSASLPQTQPNCLLDSSTRLVDCGNWAVSASWAVPANATSGIYIAKLVRTDTGGASHMIFIVRDDASQSDLLFQTSDLSWQAYNNYGGYSLYGTSTNEFDQASRAFKVSYNRPFATRGMESGITWVFNAEYPMLRWLEANGYDISYVSGIDTSRYGNLISNHKTFISVGHDEYWDGTQRANIESARNAGVNLAFLSGNTLFWKTRWENSIDGTNTAYRTLVCYKETHANAKIDPSTEWTGTWRDPRFSPPSNGGRPENAVKGTIFMVNGPRVPADAIQVPAADGKMRFWRNTSIATLNTGQTATLPTGTLGYEWDVDLDNGFRPAGLIRLSTTTVSMSSDYLLDYGTTFGAGTATHYLTLYRHASGALVFDAGSVQWSWGLDATHDAALYAAPAADLRMQQATINLFADMNMQPATIQAGLVPATASTDTSAPISTITAPTAGANLPVGVPTTITGTATDSGGVVGGVEVSVDGGATWHPAAGRASWSYTWTPTIAGTFTIRSRAADDSANLETPSAGVTITIGNGDTTPPTVALTAPANGVTVSGTAVTVSANANDAVGVTSVQFLLDGVSLGAADTSAPYSISWNTTGTTDGNHTLSARASDAANNTATATNITVTVSNADTTPPATPTGLTATGSGSGIALDWADNSETDLAGYNVYRAASAAGPFTKLNAALLTSSAYNDTAAPAGVLSYYRVTAVDTSTSESTPATTSATRPDTTAPATPTGLTATGSGSGIALDWANNSETDLAGYNVYRAASAAGPFTKLNAALLTSSAYNDTVAPAGVLSYYRVTAVDTSTNESTPAATSATRPDTTAPATPTGLTATGSGSGIALDWANNSETDLAGYNVYRAASAAGPFTKLNAALLTSSAYNDTAAPTGVLSYYRVTAVDTSTNESTPATTSATRPDTTAPATPTGLTAIASLSGIALDWANNSETDLAGYNVYRAASAAGPFTKLNATVLTVSAYDDTLAPLGTSYYRVTAIDGAGNESVATTTVNAAMAKANRVLNPGFELATGTTPSSWSTSTRFNRSSVLARSGTYSGQNSAPNNTSYSLTSSAITGLSAGTTYNVTGWTNIPATTDAFTFSLQVRWRNSLNGTISTVTIATYTAATGGWSKTSSNLVAPAGTTNAVLIMSISSLNATIYSDDFALR